MNQPTPPPPVPPTPPLLSSASSPSPIPASQDERTFGMLCHLLGIFTGFAGPLILWLVKRETSSFVNDHGREALNFQISASIIFLVLFIATMVLLAFFIGIFLIPVLVAYSIFSMVVMIIAAVAAQEGRLYRYPLTFRFL